MIVCKMADLSLRVRTRSMMVLALCVRFSYFCDLTDSHIRQIGFQHFFRQMHKNRFFSGFVAHSQKPTKKW